jgi:predicted aconitase
MSIFLSKKEERILNGEEGEILQKCYRLLVQLGEAFGADRLIPIKSVHLSGISYQSIGNSGLEFLEEISHQVKFKVRTTLNPCGMDLRQWRAVGIDESFAEKQFRILRALKTMGAVMTLTCTPYYLAPPKYGDHLSWAESSAVCYVNSVLGARTNREGALSALASAIAGVTPNFGAHKEEGRKPELLVKVKAKLKSISDYSALGFIVGTQAGNRIPFFKGLKAGAEEMKAIAASLATAGSIPMFHVEGLTPEWKKQKIVGLEKLEIDSRDIHRIYDEFEGGEGEAVFIGCPHLSVKELHELCLKKPKMKTFVCAARGLSPSLFRCLRRSGFIVLHDMCPVVSPLSKKYSKLVVDSFKAAHYLGERGVLKKREELVE